MLSLFGVRNQRRNSRPLSVGDMDYLEPKTKNNLLGKLLLLASLVILAIIVISRSSSFTSPSVFSQREEGVTHVLVTGGAGYIGSHAALRLLKDSYRVTIVDNLSRGNLGAVKVLQGLFPQTGRLQFIYADLGDPAAVEKIFSENAFDAVMHFAAVAYVGESTLYPLKYYHNITSNTLGVLEAMARHKVKKLIYSSTCATYGEPAKMPITEDTPQVPINPYGKAKKMAEDMILDFSKNSDMAVMILRYFNVIGSDPGGRLGEAPRPELREQGRISGACFDAARGFIPGLQVKGTDYKTSDGTCIRDYIDVTDLVDAHVKALQKAQPRKVGIYNVGTGKGRSVKEFVEACKKATGVEIKVDFLPRRPGDYAEVYSDPTKILKDLNWTAQYTLIERSSKSNADALWARLQEEIVKNEKAMRDNSQQIVNAVTNFMSKELNALFEKTIKKEIATNIPAIARALSPAIEKTVSSSVTESFQRGLGDKSVNQLDKSVNSKLEATITKQIQTQFQTSGRQALQEALRSGLEASLIPSFERSCKTMFEQVDAAFQKGMAEHTNAAQQRFDAGHSQLAHTLKETITSASSVAQALSRELAESQRNRLALAAAGANSSGSNTLVSQRSSGPLGALLEKVEADPITELSRLILERKYEESFTSALHRSDVSIVSWLCSQVDLRGLLAMNPLPLSQGVLLSLLQQLAFDISKDSSRKLAWMTDVVAAINPSDPMVAVHGRPIFEQVYQILHHHRNTPGSDVSATRLIMHVINSMLMACK